MIPVSTFMWVVTGASLIGVIANIKKKQWCFGVWLCTNFTWFLYDYWIGAYAQSTLFFIYTILAVWGLWEWRVKK